MGFRSVLSLGGESVLVENKVFVDATYGDDATAERENPNKPYLTIPAALVDYLEGDIMVLNGDFVSLVSIGLPWADTFVNHFVMEWLEGSSLTVDLTDTLFKTTIAAQTYEIHGRGVFRNDTVTSTGSTRVFGGKVEIFGAKSISSGAGSLVDGGGWKNIRNVEEFYTEQNTIMSVFINPLHDGSQGGFIENVHFGKLGHDGYSTNSIVTSTAGLAVDQILYINNCTMTNSSTFGLSVLLIGNGNNFFKVKVKDSRFIGNDRQRVIFNQVGALADFTNCYFENNADLPSISTGGTSVTHMTDCSFKGNGVGAQTSTTADAELHFHGTNRMQNVSGPWTMIGITEDDYYNTGVLMLNKPPINPALQYWNFTGISEPPNVGDQFTITANDGNFITATVLALDTQNDILERLRLAWIAKGEEALPNDFTHFTPQVVGAIGLQWLRGLVTDVDYAYDLEEGEAWTWSTTGAEPINTPSALNNTGVSIIGGEVNIDANLIVY